MAIDLNQIGSQETTSIFRGPQEPPLWDWTTTQLLEFGVLHYPNHTARPASATVTVLWFSLETVLEFVHIYLATIYIGAIFTIINPMFTIKEIASAIELIGPRMIFVSRRLGFRKNDEIFQMVSSLSTNAEKTVQVVYMRFETSEYGSAPSYTQFVEREKVINKHQDLERDVHVKTDDVCCFQFTSGTTGPRKVNFINNGQLAGNLLELTEKDIRCRPPPLFHWFGLVCGLLAAVSHGRTLVLPSEVFDPTKVIETLVKEKCTVFNAVPTMFQSILDQEALSAKVSSQLSLRTGIIAAASLSRDLLQRVNDRLALNGLIYPFGMTELSAVSLSTTRDISLLSNWTTVGKPLPHTSIKVIDTDGTVLPPGRSGELCLSGYLVHKGYFKVPEKSAEVAQIDENGTARLHTGDIVSLAPDGICTVLGRVKDMIKKVNAPERRDQISLAGPHCSKPEH
ncbi:AMP dependent CoA ligase [Talaromyces pinophilus]|uniref:AMP dependent CoA ligase n=1 Tax=Talaromyces pinophilus TaxID=128442 RepID=A0A478EB05_TALPI|nr:AMP dependent CoA ligase [Talaromyces pinophilus]